MIPNHPVPGLRFHPWLNKPMNAIRQATIFANLRRKP